MARRNKETRNYDVCYTLFDLELVPRAAVGDCYYHNAQLEVAPETDKIHWQGFAQFTDAHTYAE